MGFIDVARSAGIRVRHQSYKTARKYLVETMGSGCAFIDYDGDGRQDILLLNGSRLPGGRVTDHSSLSLYRNNRNGTFTETTRQAGLDVRGMYAMGVAVGDYDNDGREDFYVTCVLGPSHLYHNEGGGRFKDVTPSAGVANRGLWGASCAWLDFDNDGLLDLFVCNYVKYASLADDRPCRAGDKLIYCIPTAYETSHCSLYHNEGGGRFADVSAASGIAAAPGKSLGVAIWDYDGDGRPDIFVANDTVLGFLFHNEGGGRFKEIGVESGIACDEKGLPHSGMGIDAGDVFNDGGAALVITNFQAVETSAYVQTSPGLFRDERNRIGIGQATTGVLGFGILFLDYDNDGWKDLLQVNGHVQDDIQHRESQTSYAQPALIFHNDRTSFTEVGLKSGQPFTTRMVGRGAACGDYDNDGLPDLLITCNDGTARLWHNETPASNHWITLRLIGRKSNRDGIGAMVVVAAGGIRQRAMVRCGSSYLSQSDLRPHLGLGSATKADIEIHWPSGTVDRFAGVGCDGFYIAREGDAALERTAKQR